MNLGEQILNYRKKINLSQEELANKIGVTRQTISKWELNETSPNLQQSVELAKIFNISLDDLTNEALITKVSQTEKQVIKISKKVTIIFLALALLFIIETIAITFYSIGYNKDKTRSAHSIHIVCTLDNKEYPYAITYDETNDIIMVDGSPYIFDNIYNREKHKKVTNLMFDVNDHFESQNGHCE